MFGMHVYLSFSVLSVALSLSISGFFHVDQGSRIRPWKGNPGPSSGQCRIGQQFALTPEKRSPLGRPHRRFPPDHTGRKSQDKSTGSAAPDFNYHVNLPCEAPFTGTGYQDLNIGPQQVCSHGQQLVRTARLPAFGAFIWIRLTTKES